MKLKTSKKTLGTSNLNECKIGNMVVEVKYANTNKTLEESLLNILKQKLNHI